MDRLSPISQLEKEKDEVLILYKFIIAKVSLSILVQIYKLKILQLRKCRGWLGISFMSGWKPDSCFTR